MMWWLILLIPGILLLGGLYSYASAQIMIHSAMAEISEAEYEEWLVAETQNSEDSVSEGSNR